MTVAPAGADVTGIFKDASRVSFAQFGDSRTLVTVMKRRKRFALILLIVAFPCNLLRFIILRMNYPVNSNSEGQGPEGAEAGFTALPRITIDVG
jgi:hypothetical protein